MEFYPLTPDRWNDLERLFGEKGACGGCWYVVEIVAFRVFKSKGRKKQESYEKYCRFWLRN